MGQKNWVCATCSECFTRRYSVDRHIWNLHSGRAERVRLMDYIIGRVSGAYSPADPSTYRHTKKQPSSSKSSITGEENMSAVHHPSRDIKPGVAQPFSKIMTRAEEIDVLNCGKSNKSFYGLPIASARLEEVRNLLNLFSPPGEQPPPMVEKILANLSLRVFRKGGNDSFLEGPLKELRSCVSLADAVGLFEGPFSRAAKPGLDFRVQGRTQVYGTSGAELPEDAVEKLKQIEDLLSPFNHPVSVQNKINDLVMSYSRTGDSSVFGKALADFLNNTDYRAD